MSNGTVLDTSELDALVANRHTVEADSEAAVAVQARALRAAGALRSIRVALAEETRRWRIARGMSQTELGALLDMSQPAVSRLEDPDKPGFNPRASDIASICSVLGLTVFELFADPFQLPVPQAGHPAPTSALEPVVIPGGAGAAQRAGRLAIANALKDYRLDHGLTQAALGARLGLTQGMVSRIENPTRTDYNPRLSDINKICEVLGVKPRDLFAEISELSQP